MCVMACCFNAAWGVGQIKGNKHHTWLVLGTQGGMQDETDINVDQQGRILHTVVFLAGVGQWLMGVAFSH
jgi:hypothetical protein